MPTDARAALPCVKMTRPHLGNDSCVWRVPDFDLAGETAGMEPGEKILLEYCELTKEELDALPEFRGW